MSSSQAKQIIHYLTAELRTQKSLRTTILDLFKLIIKRTIVSKAEQIMNSCVIYSYLGEKNEILKQCIGNILVTDNIFFVGNELIILRIHNG